MKLWGRTTANAAQQVYASGLTDNSGQYNLCFALPVSTMYLLFVEFRSESAVWQVTNGSGSVYSTTTPAIYNVSTNQNFGWTAPHGSPDARLARLRHPQPDLVVAQLRHRLLDLQREPALQQDHSPVVGLPTPTAGTTIPGPTRPPATSGCGTTTPTPSTSWSTNPHTR